MSLDITRIIVDRTPGTDSYNNSLNWICKEIVSKFNSQYVKQIKFEDIIDFLDADIKHLMEKYRTHKPVLGERSHYIEGFGVIGFVYNERPWSSRGSVQKDHVWYELVGAVALGAERKDLLKKQ